jgi:photosystem II stability/assembly factor-like uncharacterized protein
MQKNNFLKFSFLLAAIAFLTTGCISFNTGSSTGMDGGLYRSQDKGTTWKQVTAISSADGRARSFAGINVASLTMDPSDHNALYFGSEANGMFYTYDGAESWQTANTLLRTTIRAIAVDPAAKCTVYTAIGNRLYKTTDCNRTWDQVYYDNDVLATIDTIAIDPRNSSVVYIGVSRGDVIKSYNAGADWQTVHRVSSDEIEKIVIDPNDSRNVFVISDNSGLFRSSDEGKTWVELEEAERAQIDNDLGKDLRDIVITKGAGSSIYLATYWGIMRSDNKGRTWTKLELIPTEKKATINALAVNPQDKNEIYYVTDTTFYRSSDGGNSWSTLELPTSRAGQELIVDFEDPSVIYMGVWKKK